MDADRSLGFISKALVLSWGLAATHSGVWTAEHETVADTVARNFVKLFAVMLADGRNGKQDGSRLQRVLELYWRVIGVVAMDHVRWHLPVVLVTFVSQSAELFMKMRLTGVKGLHTLHAVALAIALAERQYARTYSLTSTVNLSHLTTSSYLDHASMPTDMFTLPSVFAADRLDWVGLAQNQVALTTLHDRSADN